MDKSLPNGKEGWWRRHFSLPIKNAAFGDLADDGKCFYISSRVFTIHENDTVTIH